ncbi:MAG: S26 family signal peptidase [Methanomassiliicoccaceae archaeon]|nr:S26 family signal peptidase [Methanomassiliicoccaceae archaeon]
MLHDQNKSKIFAGLIIAVIIVLVGAGAYALYNINDDSFDLRDREVRLIVSGSMDGEPTDYPISTIEINSLIMIHHLDQDELDTIAVGDVIAYDRGGVMIVHRVVDIRDDGSFITKGDANNSVDPIVYPGKVIGKVVGVSHMSGELVTLAQDKMIWIFAFVACALIVIYCIREIVRAYSQVEDNEDDDVVR